MVSLSVDTSNIVDGQNIDAADVTLPLGQLKTSLEDTLNGIQAFDQMNVGSASEVTISGGSILVSRSNHSVDTEGNAATDDMDTITGGFDGDILYLRVENALRVVTVKHGTGNVRLSSGTDYVLDTTDKTLALKFNGVYWTDVGGLAVVLNDGAGLFSSLTAAIPSGTGKTVILDFDTKLWDSDGMWDAGDTTRLTCHTTGVYIITGFAAFSASGVSPTFKSLQLLLNGVVLTELFTIDSSTSGTAKNVSTLHRLIPDDYLQLRAFQTGSNTAINVTNARLAAQRIGE